MEILENIDPHNLSDYEINNSPIQEDRYNTPYWYHHRYGEFEAFLVQPTNKVYGFIKIPKCLSSELRLAIGKSKNCSWVNARNIPLSEINFFTVIRPEYDRMFSGYRTWLGADFYHPTVFKNHQRTDLPTLAEKEEISIRELIANKDIWDEHFEPSISFLYPFIKEKIPFEIFQLNSNILEKINLYLGADVLKIKWEPTDRNDGQF